MLIDNYETNRWGKPLISTVFAILALLIIYGQNISSMLAVWENNTYAHCFFIFPIACYLIWKRTPYLTNIVPEPDYRPLLLLAGLGLLWLIANVVMVNVVQQYAMILMIPLLVWTILGRELVMELLFPLLFLLCSVPVGDFMVPAMLDFTADFTVAMLRLTGIPVYRDGNSFSIPSGDWSVVDACAGLRYFIASITLGFLFAYLTYRSYFRRVVFIILSALVPILANGFRAYLIVILGHLSDMKLGVGADHFVYGWIFFGLSMALLFWVGSFWREEVETESSPVQQPKVPEQPCPLRKFLVPALTALGIAGLWPAWAAWSSQDIASPDVAIPALQLPRTIGAWRQTALMTDWRPSYAGATDRLAVAYTDGQAEVEVFIEYYRRQGPGHELLSVNNRLVGPHDSRWTTHGDQSRLVPLDKVELDVLQSKLLSPEQKLLVWRTHWMADTFVTNQFQGKYLQIRDKLLGGSLGQAALFMATVTGDETSKSAEVLRGFAMDALPALMAVFKAESSTR